MAMRQFVVFALRGSGRASNSIQGSFPAVANVRFQSDTTSQQQMNYGGRTETSQGGNHQTSDMSNTASSQNNPPSGRATTGYTGSAYGPGSGSEANATEPSQGVSKDSSAESTSNRDPRDISGGEGTSRGRSAAPGGSTGSDSNTSTRSSQSSGQQHSNYESSNSDRRAGDGSSYMPGSSTSSGGPAGRGSGSGGYGTTASTIGKVTRGASESSPSDTTAFPNSDKSTAESGTSYEEQDQGTGSKMKELSSRHYSGESGRVSKFANDDESLNQKNEQKEESRQRNSSRSSNDQQRRGSNENKDKW